MIDYKAMLEEEFEVSVHIYLSSAIDNRCSNQSTQMS
jgi:hypothetical protein